MCSSAWSVGGSNERGLRSPIRPRLSDRAEPSVDSRPSLSANHRREPRALLDFLRGRAPPLDDRGVRVHLPGHRGESDRERQRGDRRAHLGEHERPRRQRGPGRCDGRLLAQRPLVHGEPAVLGEGDRQPSALHDGADESNGAPRRHGDRGSVHDLRPGDLDSGRRGPRLRRRLPSGRPIDAARRLLRHAGRPVRTRHVLRLPVLALGPRGMERLRPPGGTDFLLQRLLLPPGRPLQLRRMGFRRRDRRFHHPRGPGPGRAAPADPRADRLRRQVLGPQRPRRAADPPGPRDRLPRPRKVRPRVPRAPRKARGEVDLTASMSTYWRTFKTAAWLGWEMDSNWTEPWLFLIYSIVKPVAGAFILIFMYVVIWSINGIPDPHSFAFLYVGNAFFIFVGSVLFGTFQVIQSDREWYQTIRYVYISPISYYVYIVGRAVSKVGVAAFAVAITLAFGVAFLGVQIHLTVDAVPLFAASMLLGLAVLLAIGICLGGISFLTAKHTHGLAEGIPGLFYVFCGVLFPLSILPSWGQAIGKAIPLTYWFDITRRLLAPTLGVDSTLAGYSDLTIMALLVVSSIAFFGLSLLIFKTGEYFARKAGKIDMTTSY